jgi:hypothetical protein
MPWPTIFKKDDLPPELQGLEPSQIAEIIKNNQKSADELKAANEKVVAAEAEKTRLSTELEAAKKGNQPQPQPQPTGNRPATSVLVDEDAAFAERTAPIAAIALNTGAQTARMVFQNGLKPGERKLFAKYEKEFDETIGKYPLEQRIFPQTYANAFRFIIGGHAEEIASDAAKGNDPFFVESAAGGGDGSPTQGAGANVKLTPEEEKVAKMMKISPEQYAKRKGEIQVYRG